MTEVFYSEELENIDELAVLLQFNNIPDYEQKANEIYEKYQKLIDYYNSLAGKDYLVERRFSHIFEVIWLAEEGKRIEFELHFSATPRLFSRIFETDTFEKKGNNYPNVTDKRRVLYNGRELYVKDYPDESSVILFLSTKIHETTEEKLKQDFKEQVFNQKGYSERIWDGCEIRARLSVMGVNVSQAVCDKLYTKAVKEKKELEELEIYYDISRDMQKVIKVWEINNFRICLTAGYLGIYIMSIPPNDYKYDFFDEGRYFLYRDDSNYFFFLFDIKRLSYWESKALCSAIEDKIRREDLTKSSRYSISFDEFESEYRSELARIKMAQEQEQKNRKMKKIMEERLKQGGFTIRDITFNRDTIEYQDQKIGIEGVPLSNYISTDMLEKTPDFLALFNRMLDYLYLGENIGAYAYNFNKDIYFIDSFLGKRIHLGNFSVTISKKETEKGMSFFYIDDIRVSKREMKQALSRGLCFATKEEYKTFLKSIRDIPLRAHDLLVNGVNLRAGTSNKYCNMHFKVRRKSGKYYLEAGETLLHVNGGFNEILNLKKKVISSNLELYRNIARITSEDRNNIVKLIMSGVVEYVNVIERARKLLRDVMSKYPDRVKEIEIFQDNVNKKGIWVKGILREYFITENADVWDYENGSAVRRRCIIDKGLGRELTTIDKIVTRIYWLLNDKYVTKKVLTLI